MNPKNRGGLLMNKVQMGLKMNLYANVSKFSKYRTQVAKEPFVVTLDALQGDVYCWSGNSNQYRTIDLDFYSKDQEGNFVPHGLIGNTFESLLRFAGEAKNYVDEQSAFKSLYAQYSLYSLNNDPSIIALREFLDAIPKSQPKCRICSKVYERCECK
jgi:hypothetical protein